MHPSLHRCFVRSLIRPIRVIRWMPVITWTLKTDFTITKTTADLINLRVDSRKTECQSNKEVIWDTRSFDYLRNTFRFSLVLNICLVQFYCVFSQTCYFLNVWKFLTHRYTSVFCRISNRQIAHCTPITGKANRVRLRCELWWCGWRQLRPPHRGIQWGDLGMSSSRHQPADDGDARPF